MKYAYVGIMMVFAFVMTYVMLRLMVANQDDFYTSQSLFDEAAFMACIMGVVEIAMMDLMEMHPTTTREKQEDLFWIGVLSLLTFYFAYRVRYQKGITSQDEFYRNMITHHSQAVHMIKEVKPRYFAQDFEFRKLLTNMQQTQEREIEYMREHLS